jgi:hypothetical protein
MYLIKYPSYKNMSPTKLAGLKENQVSFLSCTPTVLRKQFSGNSVRSTQFNLNTAV